MPDQVTPKALVSACCWADLYYRDCYVCTATRMKCEEQIRYCGKCKLECAVIEYPAQNEVEQILTATRVNEILAELFATAMSVTQFDRTWMQKELQRVMSSYRSLQQHSEALAGALEWAKSRMDYREKSYANSIDDNRIEKALDTYRIAFPKTK